MELDKLRIETRPRSTGEAIDLGFVMARHWWRPMCLSWLLTAVPLFIILHLLLSDYPEVIGLLIWWLKPLYEQAPLYLLSRALFAEKTPMSGIWRNLPKIAGRQLLLNLTWRRFNPRRSFNTPVAQLEGLGGEQRSKRLASLYGKKGNGGWLTIICACMEIAIYMALFSLLYAMIPNAIDIDNDSLFMSDSYWPALLQNTLYLITLAIMAPFYIGAGFSLYLNRRIKLEAWDIELNFRKLQERLARPATKLSTQKSGTALSLSFALAFGLACLVPLPPTVEAQESTEPAPLSQEQQTARQQIQTILADEVFGGTKTESRWQFISDDDIDDVTDNDNNSSDLGWLETLAVIVIQVAEILAWIAIGLLLTWLLYRYPQWRHWFIGTDLSLPGKAPLPKHLFGLDLRPESLPDDIPAEAWQLSQNNQIRAALSLLYRGALITLMNNHDICFERGATEGECVRQLKRQQPGAPQTVQFFQRLTHAWQQMAYGHRPPGREQIESLCNEWRAHLQPRSAHEDQ